MEQGNATTQLGRLETSSRHIHRGIECILLIQGGVELEVEGYIHSLCADDFILINSGDVHAVTAASENVAVVLRLSDDYLEQECQELYGCVFACDSRLATLENAVNYFEIKRLLIRMLLAAAGKHEGHLLEYRSLLLQLLYHLQVHFKARAGTPLPENREHGALSDMLAYMEENYRNPLSLEELAKTQYVSAQYFSKLFKKKIGVGPLEYLTRLRLEHALSNLLYTEDSVLKISMDSGFPNGKSFAAAFQKRFGQTPGAYRRLHLIGDRQECELLQELRPGPDTDMERLLGYMRKHNMELGTKTVGYTSLPLDGQAETLLVKPDYIMNIGKLECALKEETLHQLALIRQRLGFRFVRFDSLFELCPQELQENQFFSDYGLYQALQRLCGLGLTPYWHVDFSVLKRQNGGIDPTESFCLRLDAMLNFLLQSFPRPQLSHWRVELACTQASDAAPFQAFYLRVWQQLTVRLGASAGILAFAEDRPEQRDAFGRLLRTVGAAGCWPGFVSFYGNPDTERFSAGASALALRQMERHHEELTDWVEAQLRAAGCPEVPLYLPCWNTLSGKALIESGTFFRSALVLDTLVRLCGRVAGIGFWLNTYERAFAQKNTDTSILALFLYFDAKRPVYYVLDAFRRMGSELLYRDDYILACRNGPGEYTLLIYYPCYENPAHTLDQVYVDQIKKRLELHLEGLAPGLYQFKRFVFDKDNAGIFNWWEKLGAPSLKDPDVAEYMNDSVPQLFLFIDQIEGSYPIYPELSFNGVILYTIRKI